MDIFYLGEPRLCLHVLIYVLKSFESCLRWSISFMGFILILRTLQTPRLSTPADSSKVRQDNSLDLEKGFVKVMHDILIFKI